MREENRRAGYWIPSKLNLRIVAQSGFFLLSPIANQPWGGTVNLRGTRVWETELIDDPDCYFIGVAPELKAEMRDAQKYGLLPYAENTIYPDLSGFAAYHGGRCVLYRIVASPSAECHCNVRAVQRILDIDLDFFVTPVVHWPPDDERPSSEDYSVWPIAEAIEFLREKFGLAGRLPGFLTENHGELFSQMARSNQRRATQTTFPRDPFRRARGPWTRGLWLCLFDVIFTFRFARRSAVSAGGRNGG